jgi:hypothetical protein
MVNMEINMYSNVKTQHKFRDSLLKKAKFSPELVTLTWICIFLDCH